MKAWAMTHEHAGPRPVVQDKFENFADALGALIADKEVFYQRHGNKSLLSRARYPSTIRVLYEDGTVGPSIDDADPIDAFPSEAEYTAAVEQWREEVI
jgi:hypothetical protein